MIENNDEWAKVLEINWFIDSDIWLYRWWWYQCGVFKSTTFVKWCEPTIGQRDGAWRVVASRRRRRSPGSANITSKQARPRAPHRAPWFVDWNQNNCLQYDSQKVQQRKHVHDCSAIGNNTDGNCYSLRFQVLILYFFFLFPSGFVFAHQR